MSLYKPALPVLALCGLLQACSWTSPLEPGDSAPTRQVDIDSIPNATPRVEPRSKRGNPSSYEVFGTRYHVLDDHKGFSERGIASWYGTKFHGRLTSSGEPYDMFAMTAAHKHLPLPTYAEVINLENGRRIIVKINDRGPFAKNRIIDLSYVAAKKLGITARGTGLVEIRALDPGTRNQPVVATNQAAEEAQQEATRPAATANAIYLQVGAFQSQLNAERLRQRIAQISLRQVVVQPVQVAQKPIYRVRIGPLAGIGEVDQISSVLEQHGVAAPSVIID